MRTVHSSFPCLLMDHLPQCPATSESFTPVPPTDRPSQCSPLVDSPPTSSCRKLSPVPSPTPCSVGYCLITPYVKHLPSTSHRVTVHPNTSTQIAHPAPIPPKPTPSVFLTIAYCRPAWGLTHSGDLTKSSHQLGEEEVDSGTHTHTRTLNILTRTHALLTSSPSPACQRKTGPDPNGSSWGRHHQLRGAFSEADFGLTDPSLPMLIPMLLRRNRLTWGNPSDLWVPALP